MRQGQGSSPTMTHQLLLSPLVALVFLTTVVVEAWVVHGPHSASRRAGPLCANANRREFLLDSAAASAAVAAATAAGCALPAPSLAVGTLPETASMPQVAMQGTVRVSTSGPVVDFLTKGLGMSVLKREQYVVNGKKATTTTVGFGPQQLAIPEDFVPGVSSFLGYGGHFSLQLVELADESGDGVMRFYEPGNGLAYIQLGVPSYRISKVLEYGGEIISSYGFTEVVAPGGLPFRIILGNTVRDAFMFQALYTTNLAASEKFYTSELGMKRCKYPRARPFETSSFEPDQPKGSVYLSYSDDSFGVLLLPRDKKEAAKGPVRPGNVFGGLVVVAEDDKAPVVDPDGFGVAFLPASKLGKQTGEATASGKAVLPLRLGRPSNDDQVAI